MVRLTARMLMHWTSDITAAQSCECVCVCLTFGDNAFHTHQATDQVRLECAGGDVLSSKAALKSNVELLKLFGKCSVNTHHILLQCTLQNTQGTV